VPSCGRLEAAKTRPLATGIDVDDASVTPAGYSAVMGPPLPIAGLPGSSAMVCVGPPLLPSQGAAQQELNPETGANPGSGTSTWLPSVSVRPPEPPGPIKL
jgi:hypothetical protein